MCGICRRCGDLVDPFKIELSYIGDNLCHLCIEEYVDLVAVLDYEREERLKKLFKEFVNGKSDILRPIDIEIDSLWRYFGDNTVKVDSKYDNTICFYGNDGRYGELEKETFLESFTFISNDEDMKND